MKRLVALAVLAVGVTVAWPQVAMGHHILGIPHYKYGTDYPQIPYAEVLAEVGDYNIHFTYFPGTPKPGERVRFKLYAFNRETKELFLEPLKVVFRRKTTFGSEAYGEPTTIRPGVGPEKNDYKFFTSFDEATAYQVEVHFPNDGDIEKIPFPVQIGETDPRPLLLGAIGILGFAVIGVGVAKRRRKKQQKKTTKKKGVKRKQSSDEPANAEGAAESTP